MSTQTEQFTEYASRKKPIQQIKPDDYHPVKIGLHYLPPMIMIEYLIPSNGQVFHHKIRLEAMLRKKKPVEKILSFLRGWHRDYLQTYNDDLLRHFIIQLEEKFEKQVREKEIELEKSFEFEKRAVQSTQMEFTNIDQNATKSSPINEQSLHSNTLTPQDPLNYPCLNNPTPHFNQSALNQDIDLNKLTTEELNKEKAKMDKIFLKNQKKPGDEGFVYDIQVEYAPFKENEWDEDEEIQKKER